MTLPIGSLAGSTIVPPIIHLDKVQSNEKRSSTRTLNSLAIFIANCREGSDDSFSMEMMVWRDTPTFFASSSCVRLVMARYNLTLFFTSTTQIRNIVRYD